MDLTWSGALWAASWHAPWVWAVLLLLVGLALVLLEVFIPSGGILGFLAACAIFSAIAVGFMDGRPWVGFGVLATAVIGFPIVLILAFRWWPSTPLGRRMLLRLPSGDEVLPDTPRHKKLKELIHRQGVAKTKMLPSGAIAVDGRTIDAVSEGMPIDVGQRVRIIDVHGNRVVVRPVDEEPPGPPTDPFSRPAETLGLDPFDAPPG